MEAGTLSHLVLNVFQSSLTSLFTDVLTTMVSPGDLWCHFLTARKISLRLSQRLLGNVVKQKSFSISRGSTNNKTKRELSFFAF